MPSTPRNNHDHHSQNPSFESCERIASRMDGFLYRAADTISNTPCCCLEGAVVDISARKETEQELARTSYALRERFKEVACLGEVAALTNRDIPINETLTTAAGILPKGAYTDCCYLGARCRRGQKPLIRRWRRSIHNQTGDYRQPRRSPQGHCSSPTMLTSW